MAHRGNEDLVKTTVRLPESLVERLDEAIAQTPDWLTISRSELVRMILEHGVEGLSDVGYEREAVDQFNEGVDEDLVKTSVRLHGSLVERLDEVPDQLPHWVTVSRSGLLRRLLDRGIDRLDDDDDLGPVVDNLTRDEGDA
jgi:metal-responsive CopG/Arc/MetJ family transcriptional regulator